MRDFERLPRIEHGSFYQRPRTTEPYSYDLDTISEKRELLTAYNRYEYGEKGECTVVKCPYENIFG